MSKQKGTDYSKLIIWAAALVSVVRYAAAFVASDVGQITGWLSDLISVLLGLSGLGMGVLETIGSAYLFDGWRRAMPAAGKPWPFRFQVLTGFVVALFVTGLGILVPFTASRVMHVSMLSALGTTGVWLWGLAVNLAPLLLIGGVGVGQHVVKVSETESETFRKLSAGEGKLTGNFPTSWRQVRKALSTQDVAALAGMSTSQISYKYGCDERTARNWRVYAQKEQR